MLLAISIVFHPRGSTEAVREQKPWPPCATMPTFSQLSVAEKRALADAIRREKPGCSMSSVQCAFKISVRSNNELWVHVDLLIQDAATGGCSPPPGGWADHQYDSNGRFVATFPGM